MSLLRRRMMMQKHEEKDVWDFEWVPTDGDLTQFGFEKFFKEGLGEATVTDEHLMLKSAYSNPAGYNLPQKHYEKAVMEIDTYGPGGGGIGLVCRIGNGVKTAELIINGKSIMSKHGYALYSLDTKRNLIRITYDSQGKTTVTANGEDVTDYTELISSDSKIYISGNVTAYIYSIKIKFG